MLSIALVGLTRSLRGGRQDDSSDLSYSRNNPYPHETVVCLQPKLCPMPVVDWSPILLRRSALQSCIPTANVLWPWHPGLTVSFQFSSFPPVAIAWIVTITATYFIAASRSQYDMIGVLSRKAKFVTSLEGGMSVAIATKTNSFRFGQVT